MPYNNSKNTNPGASVPKKVITLITLALLAVVSCVVVYIKMPDKPKASTVNTSELTEEQQSAGVTDETVKSNQKGNTPTSTYTAKELTASNILLMPFQNSNDTVTVNTSLKGYSDGNCELTVTNGSTTIVQNADVIYQSVASSCAGFSIPIAQLGVGTWQIVLKVTSGGVTNQQSISHEVR